MTWYLVAIATGLYIGPLPQESCQNAMYDLRYEGIVCRQATAMTVCDVPNEPGVYTSCPVFDFQRVTIKP
jgi:hypothetical protein